MQYNAVCVEKGTFLYHIIDIRRIPGDFICIVQQIYRGDLRRSIKKISQRLNRSVRMNSHLLSHGPTVDTNLHFIRRDPESQFASERTPQDL